MGEIFNIKEKVKKMALITNVNVFIPEQFQGR